MKNESFEGHLHMHFKQSNLSTTQSVAATHTQSYSKRQIILSRILESRNLYKYAFKRDTS